MHEPDDWKAALERLRRNSILCNFPAAPRSWTAADVEKLEQKRRDLERAAHDAETKLLEARGLPLSTHVTIRWDYGGEEIPRHLQGRTDTDIPRPFRKGTYHANMPQSNLTLSLLEAGRESDHLALDFIVADLQWRLTDQLLPKAREQFEAAKYPPGWFRDGYSLRFFPETMRLPDLATYARRVLTDLVSGNLGSGPGALLRVQTAVQNINNAIVLWDEAAPLRQLPGMPDASRNPADILDADRLLRERLHWLEQSIGSGAVAGPPAKPADSAATALAEEPLSEREQQAADFIRSQPDGFAMAKEIATHLGNSESTVRSHLIPGLKAKRGLLHKPSRGYYFPR